jgi:hypothetical protein
MITQGASYFRKPFVGTRNFSRNFRFTSGSLAKVQTLKTKATVQAPIPIFSKNRRAQGCRYLVERINEQEPQDSRPPISSNQLQAKRRSGSRRDRLLPRIGLGLRASTPSKSRLTRKFLFQGLPIRMGHWTRTNSFVDAFLTIHTLRALCVLTGIYGRTLNGLA